MALPYTNEGIFSPEGISCRVLDEGKVSFNLAASGKKASETLVREAKGGENIETMNGKGLVESVYVAEQGDAIFVNLHNHDDIYVPGNDDGTRWQFSELQDKGYEIVRDDPKNSGVRVRSSEVFDILVSSIEEPTCLKNAWGEGRHVFLYAGATLKLNKNGKISGIDQEAFEATWKVLGI